MGSLSPDHPCGWCGRLGAGYIPAGIDPPEALCDQCLDAFAVLGEDRIAVIARALLVVLNLDSDATPADSAQRTALATARWDIASFL